MMRRLALNADGSLPPLAVPPPRPVLPTSEAAPASAGRRFSADDAPFIDEWVAPRRSAASVSSPPAYEPLLPPLTRPTAPPSRTVSYSSAAEPPPEAYRRSTPVEIPAPAEAAPPAAAPVAPPRSRASARSQATPPTRAMEPEAKPSRRDAKAAAAAARADAKAAQEAEKAAAREAAQQAKLDARSAKADAKAAKAKPTAKASSSIPASRLAVGGTTPVTPPPAPPRKSGGAKVAIIVLAVVLAVALIAGGVAWGLGLIPLGAKAPTAPAASDPLITAADVTPLSSAGWQESTIPETAVCLGEAMPKAERASSRKLFDPANDSALQTLNVYPDDAAATQAYDAAAVLAGTCADGAGLVVSASAISGLADAAQAVQINVQAAKPENHLLLIARTGRNVNVFDFVTADGVPVTTAAQIATSSLNRQCGAGGTCPTSVSVASSLPAAGTPAGWLVPSDLPRITLGAGKWNATDWPTILTHGSQCEGTDLTRVADTTAAGQRALILTGDPKTPTDFGVDEAIYTFADTKPASSLATGLIKAINGCSTQLPTATVVDGPDVRGTGANGIVVSGRTWEITHKTNTSTFIYRVAVVSSGTRVTYWVATPSKTFDFTDADWTAIALRAGQRATQAG
ncbi:MAG: hypothetical protein LWW77_03850 [Propionibacteriales bacterium]|nr:hypothetical protein [Propionibacteriales bacterium]